MTKFQQGFGDKAVTKLLLPESRPIGAVSAAVDVSKSTQERLLQEAKAKPNRRRGGWLKS